MPYRALTDRGEWKVSADTALKHRVHRVAQQRFRKGVDRQEKIREAVKAILEHPYLEFDEWRTAEELFHRARAKMCRDRLNGLAVRLQRDEIRFEGLEGTSGSPKVTPDNLRGHSVKFLDLWSDWLLFALERHPQKGKGPVLVQYWLYSREAKSLRLLKHRDSIDYPEVGPVKVMRNGEWGDPDASDEADFYRTIEVHLGGDAAKQICGSIEPQTAGLLSALGLPSAVLDECREVTRIDIAAAEAKNQQRRERGDADRYGPQRGTPGLRWITDAGIRVGLQRPMKGDAAPDPPALQRVTAPEILEMSSGEDDRLTCGRCGARFEAADSQMLLIDNADSRPTPVCRVCSGSPPTP